MSMYPRLLPGAIVLIDRHHNSLKPYHRSEQNMYGVRKGDACTIKHVEQVGSKLVLRPQNPSYPVDLIEVEEGTPTTSSAAWPMSPSRPEGWFSCVVPGRS